MYLDISRCILMYLDVHERDTSRYNPDTIKIQSGYITIHQDTYPIGNYTQKRKETPRHPRAPCALTPRSAIAEPEQCEPTGAHWAGTPSHCARAVRNFLEQCERVGMVCHVGFVWDLPTQEDREEFERRPGGVNAESSRVRSNPSE